MTVEGTFQRIGARSNAHVGSAFEEVARLFFEKRDIVLVPDFPVLIGTGERRSRQGNS